jgi:sec-independent protein translocase protein TatC
VTTNEKRRMAAALDHLLTEPSLFDGGEFTTLNGPAGGASAVKELRETITSSKSPPENEVRQLNKLLLSGYFADQVRAPQLTLVDVPVWKPVHIRVQALNAQEAFMIWMKASFMTGLVISSPWIFYQIWIFVSAGLYPHEKGYVFKFLPVSLILFGAGASLAIGFVFQPVLDFLFYFNRLMEIDPDPRIGEWLGFVLLLPLAFGLSFQLPLVMLLLNRIGLIDVKTYLEHWRVAILVIAISAMIITPGGDPYSMLLMMTPLVGLYFLGIGMCHWMPRGRNPFDRVYEP